MTVLATFSKIEFLNIFFVAQMFKCLSEEPLLKDYAQYSCPR